MSHRFFRFSSIGLGVLFCSACTITTVNDNDAGDGGGTTNPADTGVASDAGTDASGDGAVVADGATDAGDGGTTIDSGAAGDAGATDGGSTADGSPLGDGGVLGDGGDPCVAETVSNDDRDHSTALTLNATLPACLQSDTDVDFYQFTIPTSPAQGGYVSFRITDVGTGGNVKATLYAVANNGEIMNQYNGTNGGSVFLLFAGKAGATFRLAVSKFSGVDTPTPYNLLAQFTGVNDTYEPNDDRASASTIMANASVQAYLFAGYETSDNPSGTTAWDDWFKVTLGAGTANVELTDLPIDIEGRVELYNSLGESQGYAYSSNDGSSVIFQKTGIAAGDYTVKVNSFSAPVPNTGTSTAPNWMTHPYSLKVYAQ